MSGNPYIDVCGDKELTSRLSDLGREIEGLNYTLNLPDESKYKEVVTNRKRETSEALMSVLIHLEDQGLIKLTERIYDKSVLGWS